MTPHRSPLTSTAALTPVTWVQSTAAVAASRLRSDDRGEGVISAAIVVLIMAFLGAAMWAAFKLIFDDATEGTSREVAKIGR